MKNDRIEGNNFSFRHSKLLQTRTQNMKTQVRSRMQ